jgi:uncharacterized protein YdeI (YjbR/CyaY-like superfamily)
MPAASPPSDLPIHAFPTAASFEAFLTREHASAPGIYLKLAKKASFIPSITSAEAVECALCYGWIDGRANAIDDKWWTVRYTPRRAKSIWSQKNVGTVARLIEEGRMRPAGLAAIEAAKADGRWERAYAGPATMVTPEDFTEALADVHTAEAYFQSLNKSRRYEILIQLATISDKSRAKKIAALVQSMAVGTMPGTAEKASKASQTDVGRPTTKVMKAKTNTKRNAVAHPAMRKGLRPRT